MFCRKGQLQRRLRRTAHLQGAKRPVVPGEFCHLCNIALLLFDLLEKSVFMYEQTCTKLG